MGKEKLECQYEALEQGPENPTMVRSKPSGWKRSWALLLCSVLAGGWFLRPHCHHVHRTANIKDRVHTILTQTPLIGINDIIPELLNFSTANTSNRRS